MTRQSETGGQAERDPLGAFADRDRPAGWRVYRRPSGVEAFDEGEHVLYAAEFKGGRVHRITATVLGDNLGARIDIERAAHAMTALADVPPPPPQPKPPTAEIAALLADGMSRPQIAERYARPVRTVDAWIREARAEHPELPQARRGRAAEGKFIRGLIALAEQTRGDETSEPNPASDTRGGSPTTRGEPMTHDSERRDE